MNQLMIHDANAHTYEYKDREPADEHDDCFRLFRNSPGRIEFQVRATSKLSLWGRGKERRYYSTVSLNKAEVQTVIEALQAEVKNL